MILDIKIGAHDSEHINYFFKIEAPKDSTIQSLLQRIRAKSMAVIFCACTQAWQKEGELDPTESYRIFSNNPETINLLKELEI